MKLKELDSNVSLSNKNRLDNKKFFKEYVGLRYEHNKAFKAVINQLRMQNYENANQLLENIVTYGPNKTEGFRFRGEFYFTYQRYLPAWEQYDQILKVIPRDIEALFITSLCAYILNDFTEYNDRLKLIKYQAPHMAVKLEYYIELITKFTSKNHFKQELDSDIDIDLIILYGKKVEDNGSLSQSSQDRIREAINVSKKYEHADIIALGGAVHNKHFEAAALNDSLIENGIDSERIILDMTGLDVVIETFSVVELLTQKPYKNLLILSYSDDLPRQYLSLTAAVFEKHFTDINIYGVSHDEPQTTELSEIERLKSWHSTLRSAGVFTKAFFK